jgi:hypothetical protein
MPSIPTPSLAVLAVLAVLLSACAHSPGPAAPSLGTLQLHETLNIEPDAATVRLQYGRVVARNAVQEQDPFCVFEIDSVRPESQAVPPASFRIIAVVRSVETIAGMPVSTFPQLNRRVSFNNDRPTHIYYKTTFRLGTAETKTSLPARTLACMSNQNAPGNAYLMRHLTSTEIRAALGAWFTLTLNAP